MNSLHIKFELPASTAIQVGLKPETAGLEARKIVALFLYEHKRISLGKACELGGMSYWEFAERNHELSIPITYSNADLQADLRRMADV
jgi:predicted HTH domain antitoxin